MINRITPLLMLIGLSFWGCEDTKPSGKDLVGHDWVYPDMENMMAAWKFMDDGTFNVSQKMFGGSTRYGQWKDSGNGKVQLTYDDGGFVKGTQVKATDTIAMISKTQFQLGSTIYRRH
jgi:hypothetical protein